MDRLPPHSQEAEQGALGCCLLEPDRRVAELQGALGHHGAEAFYDLRNRMVWEAVVAVRDSGRLVEPVAVAEHLKAAGALEQAGGVNYLLVLMDATPSPANLESFAAILWEKSVLRRVVRHCQDTAAKAFAWNGDLGALLDEFERGSLAAGAGNMAAGAVSIAAVQQALTDAYEAASRRDEAAGLGTGFPSLDRIAGGMMPKELVVVGGTPSAGKTTLVLHAAVNICAAGTPVSFFSGETSARKLVHRMHALLGRIDSGKFFWREADTNEMDKARMLAGLSAVARMRERFFLHDAPLGTDLVGKARADYQRGSRFFVVDYLQLIDGTGGDEFERVTNAVRMVKRMAKELDSPVVLVSSLSRPEKGSSRKPRMNDLRQSGQIEYDADKIVLLHVDDKDRDEDSRDVDVHVAKNKDGKTGSCTLRMVAPQFRFEDPEAEERAAERGKGEHYD